jgi:hypothetical protein
MLALESVFNPIKNESNGIIIIATTILYEISHNRIGNNIAKAHI